METQSTKNRIIKIAKGDSEENIYLLLALYKIEIIKEYASISSQQDREHSIYIPD